MTDAPKIDTQAPERIWIAVSPRGDLSCDSKGQKLQGVADHREYERRDLADARAAAAAQAMREAAAGIVYKRWIDGGLPDEAQEDLVDAIRALPLPDTAALDRLIAEAELRGMRKAACIPKRPGFGDDWMGMTCAILATVEERIAARGSKEGQS